MGQKNKNKNKKPQVVQFGQRTGCINERSWKIKLENYFESKPTGLLMPDDWSVDYFTDNGVPCRGMPHAVCASGVCWTKLEKEEPGSENTNTLDILQQTNKK